MSVSPRKSRASAFKATTADHFLNAFAIEATTTTSEKVQITASLQDFARMAHEANYERMIQADALSREQFAKVEWSRPEALFIRTWNVRTYIDEGVKAVVLNIDKELETEIFMMLKPEEARVIAEALLEKLEAVKAA